MRLTAAASTALRPVLAGPARPARWLGAAPPALYLALSGQRPGVLALLAHDAARLPCGMLLPSTSAELPLTALAPAPSARDTAWCVVGDGRIAWQGPDGPVAVSAVRQWAPARAAGGKVLAGALAAVTALLGGDIPGVGRRDVDRLGRARDDGDAARAVAALLGRGPGLTPAGDDVLAGFLVGARAFGLPAPGVRRAVARLAAARTSRLSAALLWHAARGECAAELAALADAVTGRQPAGPATTRLLAVGHSSGPALAHGLALAGERALHRPGARPGPGPRAGERTPAVPAGRLGTAA